MFEEIICDNGIEYGIIDGNDKLLYIKVGNGGDIYGNENKYLTIAKLINSEFGFSILVAGNPVEMSTKAAIMLDSAFIENHFPSVSEIYGFGHSNGGQMLISYGYLNPKISRILSVNAPITINFHKTKNGIRSFRGESLTMIYGSRDQSYRYVKMLESCENPNFEYSIIEDADHGFSEMLDKFISLPKTYLFYT